MAAELDKLRKPFRKLRKLLKRLPNDPSADDVHKLRTEIRRAEAAMAASMLDQEKDGLRLAKSLRPIRKASGHVRDMDVLVGFASTLSSDRPDQCLVRLLEHLSRLRLQNAAKLRATIARRRKKARRCLVQCMRRIEKDFEPAEAPTAATRELSPKSTAAALVLSAELSRWPRLNHDNLHPFRLKVKELRYILQLDRDSDTGSNAKFIGNLGNAKDVIGEWHDWNELASIAAEALKDGAPCDLLERIERTAKKKLTGALATANALRARYLESNRAAGSRLKRRPSDLKRRPAGLKITTLRAAAKFAA